MLHAYQIVYIVLATLACGSVLWIGSLTERVGIAIVVLASLASYPAAVLSAAGWHQPMAGEATVDLMTTTAFFVLMLRSSAFWPIWSCGFCLAMMMAHLMRYVQASVPAWSYYDTTSLWAYPILGSIVLGAAQHRWRKSIAHS